MEVLAIKARSEWKTKAKKRKEKESDKGIVELFFVIQHFFHGKLNDWIAEMTDPRHPSYTTYTQGDLICLGLLKNICAVETMRQMNEKFNEETCIKTLALLSGHEGLEELPDYGTVNYYLEQLSPDCLSQLRRKMVAELIRSKVFNQNRLLNKYWIVVLDGTGLFHFKERHCENCLVREYTDEEGNQKKDYFHKVLEAKILLADHLVISLGTEFIENENEEVSKQDCENAAAKRLMARLKKEYPRLPVCILGDGLYCVEPLMGICRKNGWKYLLNLKEGTQRNITKEFACLAEHGEGKQLQNACAEKGRLRYYNHVEEIADKKETFHVLEYEYSDVKGKHRFLWATNIKIREGNAEELAKTGRKRWKIENEGFNNQKNGIYKIEHLNSRNSNAMKNHYLLTQIADILMQLYLATNKLVKSIGQSIKNTSSRLLESFRRQTINEEDVLYIARHTSVHLL